MLVVLATPAFGGTKTAFQLTIVDLILQSGGMAKFVLILLAIASIFSWAIILMKRKSLKIASKESKTFLNVFWYGQDLEEVSNKSEKLRHCPLANVFKSGYKEFKKISSLEGSHKHQELSIDNVNRALTRATLTEIGNLEKAINVLATVGSASPFVGLFGTVWGIMNSFQNIGATGSANLAIVAPGISEALITTAAGLAAAIPAVVAYNHFVGKIKRLAIEMDAFSQDFLNIVQRSTLKSHGTDK